MDQYLSCGIIFHKHYQSKGHLKLFATITKTFKSLFPLLPGKT